MATVEKDELRGLDDGSLRRIAKQARDRFRALADAPDPGVPEERERILEEIQEQGSLAQAASGELQQRETRRSMDAHKHAQAERWASSDENRRPGEAAKKALWLLRNTLPPPLTREDFRFDRLSDKEGGELLTLTREVFARGSLPGRGSGGASRSCSRSARIVLGRSRPRAPPPPCPPLPEMLTRDVALPSYLLAWIVADPRKTGLDSLRVGVLWKIVAGLENRQPVLVGSRIEEVDGEPYMVVASTDRLRVDAGDGSLAQPEALRYLAAQGLLVVQRKEGEIHVGLGPKLRKFRDAEGGDNDGN